MTLDLHPLVIYVIIVGAALFAELMIGRAVQRAARQRHRPSVACTLIREREDVFYATTARISITLLANAYREAERLLIDTFGEQLVRRALDGVTIVVENEVNWSNANGRRVISDLDERNRLVYVARGLHGLAHELAHLVEFFIDGRVDANHVKWPERHLLLVESRYGTWLDAQYAQLVHVEQVRWV